MWTYQRVLSFILFFISQVPYGIHCMGWRIGLDVFGWRFGVLCIYSIYCVGGRWLSWNGFNDGTRR